MKVKCQRLLLGLTFLGMLAWSVLPQNKPQNVSKKMIFQPIKYFILLLLTYF